MKKKENILAVTFGLLGLASWYFPSIDLKYKIAITLIVGLSIALILFKESLSYFFRKYWAEIISISLLSIFYIIFKNVFPELLIPAIIILLGSSSIAILISFKYGQSFIYKSKLLLTDVAINNLWRLNHWGTNYASIVGDKMVFKGTGAGHGVDGSHIDLNNILEVGKVYEISCFVRSDENSTGMFQLWCHDQTGITPDGAKEASPFQTPSIRGEIVKLNFRADYNKNIRIHLQYTPGLGQIEVSNVKLYKLNE